MIRDLGFYHTGRMGNACLRRSPARAPGSVLLSVYRTLKRRGRGPAKTIADALKTNLTTGNLP